MRLHESLKDKLVMAVSHRRYVSQLGDNDSVDQVFLASDKQLRPNRNGNLYLQVELSDRSGMINARMWNATESDYRNFENGDYVHVEGSTQIFQGSPQLIATRIRKASPGDVDESDFLILTPTEIDKLAMRASELLRTIKNVPLRNLAECYLMDEQLMQKLTQAPAGIKNHHAYRGGLIEHIVNLMEVVTLITPRYPEIDSELLLFGAFVHDLGKIEEMSYERDLAYTDAGQLLGHIVIALGMLDKKIKEAEQLSGEPFPEDLSLRIKHMVVSHHGEYEYGSPRLPMTLEAVALHYLDNLDAKIHHCHHLIEADANADSSWTQFQHNLGRKLYKGPLEKGK